MFRPFEWKVRGHLLSNSDRTLLMGIVNVTPDSFSDGGRFLDPSTGIAHGLSLVSEGAHIVDVGGESSRPGADEVDVSEEIERVVPVVAGLSVQGVVVSVDTTKAAVAEAALEAGASIINDISSLGDPAMAQVVARHQAGLVVMHMQGTPKTMQTDPSYVDIVDEVSTHLIKSAARAIDAGIDNASIAIDPGIGFGKAVSHNLALLGATSELAALGYPLLLGISRKRFLAELSGVAELRDRDRVSAAVGSHIVGMGCGILRVHNVKGTRQLLQVVDPLIRSNLGQ